MRRVLAACCAALLLSGCELLTGLQHQKVLAAAVVTTPGVASTQVPGFSQSFPAIAAKVTARLFFGELPDASAGGGSVAASPQGIDGALVTVQWRDAAGADHVVPLHPGGAPGAYEASADDGVAYVVGATYAFDVAYGDERHGASVSAPAPAAVAELPPEGYLAPPRYADFDAQTLTFQRSGDDLAFYAAFELDPADAALGAPTCTNFPLAGSGDPRALVGLALDPASWERSSYVLSRDPCFPRGPGADPAAYAIALGIARRGTVSDGLFSGSSVLAAAFDAGTLVFTR